METVGFVGVGKIGLPAAENLIKSGYRVLGYRRGSLAEFEKIGGVAARSPAEIGAETDIVFSCLPSSQALEEVVHGPHGLIKSARPGQIIIELGSHPVPEKERHVDPLAAKGAIFLDGGEDREADPIGVKGLGEVVLAPSPTRSSMPPAGASANCSAPKSSPTGPTGRTSVKKLAAREKCTAAPPSIRSRSPKGVLTASKAIDPTTVSAMRGAE